MQKFFKWCLVKILSEEFFGEFYADTSDCPSDIYTSVSDDSSSEYSFDSDSMDIRPTKTKNFSDLTLIEKVKMVMEKIYRCASLVE